MEASRRTTDGTGWATFAAVMIMVLGTFNIIWGVVAVVNDSYFLGDELLFWDLTFWGIVHMVIGAVQFLAAILIFSGSEAGAVLGIAFACLNAIGALLAIGAYPIWSIIILVLDALVIYALTVYGDALRPT